MRSKSSFLIKIFHDHSAYEDLSPERLARAIAEYQQLPWIKRMGVFSSQAVVLVELQTGRYLYVSPSVPAITGYTAEQFTGLEFRSALMSEGELEIAIEISRRMMSTLASLKLSADEMLRLRSTRNSKLKRPDGRWMELLEQGFVVRVNSEGVPVLQLLVVTDITEFCTDDGFFYSLTLFNDSGSQKVLLSGCINGSSIKLTPRQLEIASMLCDGLNSSAISQKLGISEETVKNHKRSMFEKTGTKTTVDLVRYSLANGLL